jgi:sugar diacid utilization regulator
VLSLDDVDAFRNEVLDRLEQSLPSIVEAMFEDVLAHVAELRDRKVPGEPADLHSAVQRGAEFFLRTLRDNRRLAATEIVTLEVIGAQRARQGFSRDAMSAAIQAAMRTGYKRLVHCALGIEASSDTAVRAMGQLSMRLFDFVQDATSALTVGYIQEMEQQVTTRVREQAALVDRLLEASWLDEGELRGHAKLLGFELEGPSGVLLVTGGSGQEPAGLRTAATAVAEAVAGAIEGPARSSPIPHVVLMVSAAGDGGWDAVLQAADQVAARHGVFVLAAGPVEHLGSLNAVYRRAQPDMMFLRAARGGPGAVPVKDLKAYRILAGAPLEDRLDFVHQILGPVLQLSEHKAVELLDTLEALYDHRGSVAEVAAELKIHDKTVRYRLRRVQELTGLSSDVPGDRLQLDIAVRLRRLAMAEVSPFDDPAWGPPSARRR